MSTRTLYITLLASEWKSSKGGLSTMNRELAIQLAKHPNVSVTFFVPKCSDEDKQVASSYNVKIVEAEELPGYEPVDWLAFPPKHLVIDFVVGHGVVLGKQAQIVMKSHQCKWVQVVHTAPDELAMYKGYSGAISKGEEKQWAELELCKMADLVVAVGPKLMEFYSAYLTSCGKRVYNFTPGIFTELSSLKLSSQSGKKFRLLVFGRGDTEDFELKGYDIAAQAVAKLKDKSYHLTFVGALKGKETEVTAELLKQGLDRSQLIVKGYLQNREYLTTLLCASNLVIIPSRTEGFGLTALEALSAGLPFLVSQNSGIGEALQEISLGSTFIVDSEDPEQWAEAIKRVRQKGSETAIQECQELRTQYAEKYSWKMQSKELLSIMLSSYNGASYSGVDQSRKEQEMSESSQSLKQRLPQKCVTPSPVRIAEPLGPLRPPTSLPERSTAREEVQSPSTDARGETRAPHIRDQGARPKEKSLSSTESTLDLKERPYADDRVQSTKPDVPVDSRAHGISEKTSSSTETIKDLKGDDLSKKEEISEYHPSKQMLSPRPITPPSVSRLESVSSWRPSSFLPERPYTGDSRVQSTKPVVPVESRANPSSDQGARPKEKWSSSTETKDLSIVRGKKEESKSQQRRGESGLQRWDTLRLEDKPKRKDLYPIASAGHATKEHASLYTAKEDNFQRLGGSDPLQWDTFGFEQKPNTTFPSTTYRENAAYSTERAGRFQETAPSRFKKMERRDLSVVGWNAKQESLSAVTQLIQKYQKHRDILNLSTDLDVLNFAFNDIISYLENNPRKCCVLVVDAERVKAVRDQERGVNYLRLLQTAERNVAEKIIITVCCPRSLSRKDKSIVDRTIEEAFKDNSEVFVTWFVNGKLVEVFAMLFTTNQPVHAQETDAASGASRDFLNDTVLPSVLGALSGATLPTMLMRKIFGKF